MTERRPSHDLTPSLVIRLRDGDDAAGGLLEELYRPAMIRFAQGYLKNREEAEDAVQEIFCKVLETAAVPEDFRVWLYRIARNHCLNLVRSKGRRRDGAKLPSQVEPEAPLTGQLTRLVDAEERAFIAAALEALPEPQREALRLRYGEGLSRDEIARILELSPSVVKSRLFEGLKRLRESGAKGPDSA